MATVTIGGRELRVLERHEAGSFAMEQGVVKVRAMIESASSEDLHFKLAQLVLCYVSRNDGVTIDWLIENLPADISPVIRACIVASGGKVKEPDAQGEAPRP